MTNPMDKMAFNTVPFAPVNNVQGMFQQALQNPKAFEEQFKRSNPQAYQQACTLRNSLSGNVDLRSVVLQMAQARGISPDMLANLGFK